MTEATMVMLGTIGIGLLVAGVLVIVVEMVLMAIWSVRMGRRMEALSKLVASERAEIQSEMDRLRRAIEETRALWQPYRRVIRWLRHPLILAVLGSYRRSRMAAR